MTMADGNEGAVLTATNEWVWSDALQPRHPPTLSPSPLRCSASSSLVDKYRPTALTGNHLSLALCSLARTCAEEMAGNGGLLSFTYLLLFIAVAALLQYSQPVQAKTRHYNFHIRLKKVSRLCHSKYIVTANGKFPGPTIYAREGDTVLVNVTNHVKYNVTIHWHGVRQLRTGWSDGPAYITQCPIRTGHSFLYNFTIIGQRGTLFWHAHILWLRATLHGPIVILPPKGIPYPFPKPDKEITVVLGQWWNSDTEAVINEAMAIGRAPNVSDAHTINGKPGPLFNYSCPTKDTFALNVESNKTYMLRVINAGMNEDVFFEVAGHALRVVEVDATYVKPFDTKSLFIAPGQTSNVLLKTDSLGSPARYFMSVRTFMDAPIAVDNKTTTAILQYADRLSDDSLNADSKIVLPTMPAINDSAFVTNFCRSLRSLNSVEYPARVPQSVDKKLFFTVGLALDTCPTCVNGTRVVAAINNVSFVMPNVSLLQAHYFNISGVFTADFPENPPQAFNYTGQPPKNIMASKGTRVTRLAFNSSVELVLQDTNILGADSHPIHLHGFNFFVVGRGVGNYDAKRDPLKFNLVDPPERNTVPVPTGGWTAIRWRADNPGVWFMHCHFEVHTTWGLKMAFVVDNGPSAHQSILPPPHDLPKC